MDDGVVEVTIRSVLPTNAGFAVFLQNGGKTFVIYVDREVGAAIYMALKGKKKPRPLTHDLIGSVLRGFEMKVEKVVINDLRENTFFARLFISGEIDSGRRVVEIDGRPSDCIAIAQQQGAGIYMARQVLDEVKDVSAMLEEE